jgi:hypothetical protein
LQEQLRQRARAFCRARQFELNARKKNPDMRISANIHYEFGGLKRIISISADFLNEAAGNSPMNV